MADAFISYSRKDIAFARLLHQAFEDNDLETWIDWQDIPPSTEWLTEVFEAIEQADNFIFIISGKSIESDICKLETAHALKNNKRIIPIVIDEVEPHRVTPELASLNWLFFREQDEFSGAFQDLVTAIQTDYAWVKEHTRLQVRALEWERKNRNSGYLLRGRDLAEAEQWLAQAENKDPQPTDLHLEYLAASRKSAKRRKRITVGATVTSVAIIIAAVLVIVIIQTGARKQKEGARLLQAAVTGTLDDVKKALDKGADVNARDAKGSTSLEWAALDGDAKMAKLLLDRGADVNAREPTNGEEAGWTPLHNAAEEGQAEVARLLLDRGANVNARDDSDATPLYYAEDGRHAEVAKLLREHGGVK